ncbi:MAG: glycerol-3-phosphate acyltransferase [Woeseiaceae bacterium]
MDAWALSACIVSGYFIGALSFARLVGSIIAPGEDLSYTDLDIAGSDKKLRLETVSATSISARKGALPGCATAILDMAKVALPMLAINHWYSTDPVYMLAYAVAAIIGHNYPVYHRFEGGRGLSPIIGSLLVIQPLSIPVTMILSNVVGLLILRDAMAAYTLWLFFLIPWMWLFTDNWLFTAYAALLPVLYLVASIPDIRRYWVLQKTGEFNKANSVYESLEHTDLGRPIKYLRKYGLLKKHQDNPSDNETNA